MPKELRMLMLMFFVFLRIEAFCQRLVANDYETGYVQDGRKVSVWEYRDENGELELKVNHTTGKVYYLREDTTDFVIFKGGRWIKQKLQIYPIPLEGYYNFYRTLMREIRYSEHATGEVVVSFEVDTAGIPGNYSIVKDIGANCANEVLRVLRENETPWIHARMENSNYRSRFLLRVFFTLKVPNRKFKKEGLTTPLARQLKSIAIVAKGAVGVAMSHGGVGRIESFGPRAPIEKFNSIEEALHSGERIQRLSLPHSNIQALPTGIGKLKRLRLLDLEGNELRQLSREIGLMRDLEELYLPINKLKDLPYEIMALKSLKVLSLGANRFVEFPKQICTCSRLEKLDLGGNRISQIPPCIEQLKRLRIIALQDNNITALPDEFYSLKGLETIYLKNNPLTSATIERLYAIFRDAEIIVD